MQPLQARWIAGTVAVVAFGGLALAQQAQTKGEVVPASTPAPPVAFDKVVVRTTEVAKRVYMLQGAGGNVTVAVADDGVIVVDNQFAPMYPKLKAAIAALTPLPVRYVVNTHYHFDHTGGNEAFAKDGAAIVAHENVRTRLAEGSRNGLRNTFAKPYPQQAWPQLTYKDTMTLRLQGQTAVLRNFGDMHTDGDTIVTFQEANVIVTGDVAFFGRFPNIDFVYRGTIDGQIRGVDELVKIVGDDSKVVPGHGPVGSKATLTEYRHMLVTARDRIRKLKMAGKSEDEIIAERPNADYDTKFGVDARAISNFIRVIYRSLAP